MSFYQDVTSPLLGAIKIGDNETAELYIKSGRYLTVFDNEGGTPLHWAVEKENLEIIGWLLEAPNVDKNAKDYRGNSPLHVAASKSLPIAKCLLQLQCDVSARNQFDRTPLHLAIGSSSTLVAEELLKRGAGIDCIDSSGYTPLHCAVFKNNVESVCMLLCYGADVTIQCKCAGLTPFMYAVYRRNFSEIAKILFNYYDDFSATCYEGYSAASVAAKGVSPLAVDIVKTGVNCIPLGFEYDLLYCALKYPTAELFREVWHRVDLKNVSSGDLLYALLNKCSFPLNEWLQCFYDILDSFTESKCNELATSWYFDFIYLFLNLHKRNVPLNDIITITVFFFTYGFRVCLCYLDIIYALYGCRKEFEIILNCFSFESCCCGFGLFPLISFILGLDKGTNLSNVISLLQYLLKENIMILSTTLIENNVVNALEYFSLPYHVRDTIIQSAINPSLKEKIKTKLTIIPEIPSLMELTRNEIRESVKKNCINSRQQYTFYQSVKKLKLPQKLLDIILFKESLYK